MTRFSRRSLTTDQRLVYSRLLGVVTRRLAALAAVAVSAGCADLQWQKPGATAEALENDLAECRGEARRNAGPDPRLVRPDAGRIVGMDSTFRPSASSGQLDGDRFLVEHDLTRICMQRRDYELVPAEKR